LTETRVWKECIVTDVFESGIAGFWHIFIHHLRLVFLHASSVDHRQGVFLSFLVKTLIAVPKFVRWYLGSIDTRESHLLVNVFVGDRISCLLGWHFSFWGFMNWLVTEGLRFAVHLICLVVFHW
jgi:hypothetical protein